MGSDRPLESRCYKCRTKMIYVTSLPHPHAPHTMQRTTFVCRVCNQTRSYSLSATMAEAYAAASAPWRRLNNPSPNLTHVACGFVLVAGG